MDKLDRIVVSHIEERLLDPGRIEDVLASLLDRRQESVERRSQHIAELNQRAAEADMRLKRPPASPSCHSSPRFSRPLPLRLPPSPRRLNGVPRNRLPPINP